MHVLAVATGSHGDVYPLIGLARSLARRGHQVELVSNEHFRRAAEDEGLEFVAAGTSEQYGEIINDPRLWDPRRGIGLLMEVIMKFLPAGYELLKARIRPGETVLVASSLSLPARLIRETHATPLVTVHLAPSVLRSVQDPIHMPGLSISAGSPAWVKRMFWRFADRFVLDPLIAPKLNAFRASLGLRPVRRVFDRWLHSPDCVLGMFPEWFARKRPDWPAKTHLTGFPLYDAADHECVPDSLEEFMCSGPAPVLIAPGTANVAAADFFRASLAACERAGLRAVLVTRYSGQVPAPLPDWARHYAYLPFSRILERCAVSVHHGGIGSLSQGLRAGIPQLVRPMAFDQFDNGQRAAALGVARMLPVRDYRPDRVAKALTELTSSGFVSACREIASRFDDDDALDRAAGAVEECAASAGD